MNRVKSTGKQNRRLSIGLVLVCLLVLGQLLRNSAVAALPTRVLHRGEHGLFVDSCVTDYDAWHTWEEADYLPRLALPAYVGTGSTGMMLDASGLQALDCRLASTKRYGKPDNWHVDDLYVFGERLLGRSLAPNTEMFNLLPLAWSDYDLEVDGQRFPAGELDAQVLRWRRVVDWRRAVVSTTLVLKSGLSLTLSVFAPQAGALFYVRFSLRSTDGRLHRVRLWPKLHLTLRQRSGGGPLLDKLAARGTSAGCAWLVGRALKTGQVRSYEDYTLAYGVAGGAESHPFVTKTQLGVELRAEVGKAEVVRDVAFFIGSSQTGNASRQAILSGLGALSGEGFETLERRHAQDWSNWWQRGADLHVGDPLRELLFHSSLYLFRSGSTWRNGVPMPLLTFHPEPWGAGTFWDLDFMAAGMLAANHPARVRRVCEWLGQVAAPRGRTFHWATRYDGTQALNPKWPDKGYLVNAAHAMTIIRYYEATHDEQFLASTGYPLLLKVARYLTAERFVKEGDHYIGGSAGLDVGLEGESNETYSTVWFAVILKKTADYASHLQVDASERAHWLDIVTHLQLEQGPDGYHQSRSVPQPGQWVSLLLYPTEAAPLLDLDAFHRNRATQCWLKDYGTEQPWCYFWQALSDLRLDTHQQAVAEEEIQAGLRDVFGPGYFCEIIPGGPLEGLPPHGSAHGAYLAATVEQFVSGSLWEPSLRLLVDLPASYRQRELDFERLYTCNGVTVSGHYSPGRAILKLRGAGDFHVMLRVPELLQGGQFEVRVAGRLVTTTGGPELVAFPLELEADGPVELLIGPALKKSVQST